MKAAAQMAAARLKVTSYASAPHSRLATPPKAAGMSTHTSFTDIGCTCLSSSCSAYAVSCRPG